MTPDTLASFEYWMNERWSILQKRKAGHLPPWTDDPILGGFRFCNVRREDDKVTVWVKECIRKPYADHPNLWLMLAIARTINWPDTLQELITKRAWPSCKDFTPDKMTAVLEARQARGEQVYTGAYLIRPESDPNRPWYHWSKNRYISEVVCGNLWTDQEKFQAWFQSGQATLEGTHILLSSYYGWGPFMAYQAIVDMRFTGLLDNALDVHTWAAAGPGTIRGLNRLHGREFKKALTQKQALEELRELYAVLKADVPHIPFDFSDVPNICCEVDKWLRMKNGEGKMRSTYKPTGASQRGLIW